MSDEKRMAGDYEVLQAVHIGDREVVFGENPADTNGQRYMCAFCQKNDLFACYNEVLASDSYTEILKIYGERVAAQTDKALAEQEKVKEQGIDDTPLTADDCNLISYKDDIEGKVIVIKPESLRPEYRRATYQLKLCKGGFGAHGNSRGSACFCADLYSGRESRFERRDVLGTIEPERLPEWAKQGLVKVQQEREKTTKEKEER